MAERPFPSLPTSPAPPSPPHRLYAHLAWTTLGRLPMVEAERRAAAESHLLALCRWLDLEPVETCVLADRVHLLVRFRPGLSLNDVVRRLQAGSEAMLTRAGRPVRWSRRYAAVTVSPSEVRRVRRRMARRAERADSGSSEPSRPPPWAAREATGSGRPRRALAQVDAPRDGA